MLKTWSLRIIMWQSNPKCWCVLEFGKNKQCTIVQRSFRRIHHTNKLSYKSILEWCNNFIERKGHSGCPGVPENVIERVRDNYLRSPKKSKRRCSQKLQLLQRTVCKILCKCLRFTPDKLQLVHQLYCKFYLIVQELMENYPDLLSKIIFSDEAPFHLSGKMNKHSVRIWGTQRNEFERKSPKVNVFCAVTERAVYEPFFFEGLSITGSTVALMFAG
ncbi:hypothetical protein PoB_002761300 [Plakobranchus ocellatus]|uniref:DUF4817 domain-containing protein n=1 Tax=Plakobranchus ocellatus TaxID=259542 RepID=A0AAV4A377_9GAST|nr:hypothetical protein PoB_002761300 [Plakobranchus ocellatus]